MFSERGCGHLGLPARGGWLVQHCGPAGLLGRRRPLLGESNLGSLMA